ncbi:nuclear valosin-containing protein-like [Cylas formicarius]|uniref:nuclear valosin-containing protein-like n=1 Tax=Cylas formicarius TaxID=197179 RepID=UPI0029587F8C|nr:nuclear valosin-containing protein-like [Cylas formicarius]
MGKINNKSGLEIIPLNDKNKNDPEKTGRMPYISDPSIVPRVQKYLESNIDKTYVDINQMADDLQRRYKEYARRKRSVFRASVKKAYSIVLQSYGLEDRESSDEDVLSEDSDEDNEKFDENSADNQDPYNRRPIKPKQMDENELIDISSEDSEEEALHNDKKTNGPSTSKNQPEASLLQGFLTNRLYYEKRPCDPLTQDKSKKRKLEATIMPITSLNKRRKVSHQMSYQEPEFSFKDIGGMDKTLEDVYKVLLHVKHPELYRGIGGAPPRGILLSGPPGSGKTLLANAIAGELNMPMVKMAAPELEDGVSGDTNARIGELFRRAQGSAQCVFFIDDIDAVAKCNVLERVVPYIFDCVDDLNNGDAMLILGATSRPDLLDAALRRAARFDVEISLKMPDRESRVDILKVLTSGVTLDDDVDHESLADRTPGFVGADLAALIKNASVAAAARALEVLGAARKAAASKAAEEKARSVAGVLKIKAKQLELTKRQSEDEAEIIVDDDSKSATPKDKVADVPSDSVVVLDDVDETVVTANKKDPPSPSALKANAVNGDAAAPAPVIEDPEIIVDEDVQDPAMPVDPKPTTALEDLKTWLRDPAPFANVRNLCVAAADFDTALKGVESRARTEGFATMADAAWDDVGALRDAKEELQMSILAPARHPKQFEGFRIAAPAAVLLCGPPGCGKTLLAKAAARDASVNFLAVKGPEMLSIHGDGRRAARLCFERARSAAPCVLFLDEIEALCPKPDGPVRVLNPTLSEMDRLERGGGVMVLAATNRPDLVDPAALRPGRFEKILYIGLPSREDRVDILRALTKNGTRPTLDAEVDLVQIGTSEQTKGFTGSDLAALVREASLLALKEYLVAGDMSEPEVVYARHFVKASEKIRPSVGEKDQKHYDKLRRTYSAVPEHADVEEMEYS